MEKRVQRVLGVLTLSSVGLWGCAHGTPPTDTIANAEKTVTDAQSAAAGVTAPLELKLAQENIDKAKDAVKKEEYDTARSFAERAQADADLALAKARSAKSQQVTKEMQDSINSLREEIQRSENAATEGTK